MNTKPKPCKGRNDAKDFGCNKVYTLNSFHKGLCSTCWIDWLLNTSKGAQHRQKATIKAVKIVSYNAKVCKTENLRKIMSVDGFRSKVLQPLINEIARIIDYGQPCIATGTINGKMNGGHYKSVGAHRNMSLNLHNIHIQSFQSNHFKSGDEINYRNGLINIYGENYLNEIENLIKITCKFSKIELEQAFINAKIVKIELKKNLEVRSAAERIALRSYCNAEIGLFSK